MWLTSENGPPILAISYGRILDVTDSAATVTPESSCVSLPCANKLDGVANASTESTVSKVVRNLIDLNEESD